MPSFSAEQPKKGTERIPVAHSAHTWVSEHQQEKPRPPAGSAERSSLGLWAGGLNLSLGKAAKRPPGKALAFHSPIVSLACLIRSEPSASTASGPGQPIVHVPGGQALTCSSGFGVKAPCLFPLTRKPGLSFLKLGRPRSFSLPKEEAFPVLRPDLPSADFTA